MFQIDNSLMQINDFQVFIDQIFFVQQRQGVLAGKQGLDRALELCVEAGFFLGKLCLVLNVKI